MDAICKITTNRSTTPPRATCRWITRETLEISHETSSIFLFPFEDSYLLQKTIPKAREIYRSSNRETFAQSFHRVNSYRFPLSGALKSQHSWPFTTQPRRGLVLRRFHVETEQRIVPSPSQRLSLSYIFIKASKWRCNGVEQPGVMMFRRGPRPSREIPRVIVASKQQRSGGQRSKKCCHNTTTVHWPWLQRH